MNVWIFLGEMLETAALILIGNGVVTNCLYKKTDGSGGGLITIACGWGLAVLVGVLISFAFGAPGQLNPAVTLAMWIQGALGSGLIAAGKFFAIVASQVLGAIIGQLCVMTIYWNQSKDEDAKIVKWSHCTSPKDNKKPITNLFAEFLGTSVLITAVFILFVVGKNQTNNLYLGASMVALVVVGIGLSFGITGWAINPVRDLIPRIMYQLTPYQNKTSAGWSYSWIPVVGPFAAGAIIGLIARFI